MDILQETFISVWKCCGSYKGESKFITWIIGIARNKLNDHFRKVYSQKTSVAFDEEIDSLSSNQSSNQFQYNNQFRSSNQLMSGSRLIDGNQLSSESQFMKLETKIDIENLLKVLPESDKELIYMVFNLEMKYSEISSILEIPEGTVKSRMARIRRKLKSLLKEYNGGEANA
jgi:RNA polymerase sigma-70 factor (ECF subfamily)